MIGTILTIAIIGYYNNSCFANVNQNASCRI